MNRQRWWQALRLVAFMCFGLGVVIYLLGRTGTTVLPTASTYNVEADVYSSIALAKDADVRESGVLIGKVTAIKQAGAVTALKLSINKTYAPFYNNAAVEIRAKSVAGENYVQVSPGSPDKGQVADNAVMHLNQEAPALQDDDVFSILNTPERANLSKALKGLGNGLQGQGGEHLNNTLQAQAALVQDGQAFSQIVDEERSQTADLVHSFDGVTGALGARAADIQTLTKAALVTSQAVSARNADLRSTIDALPAFLRDARTVSGRLGSFSTMATPVFANLKTAVQNLVPVMDNLKPAADEADVTLSSLQNFADTAQPTFKDLRPFTQTVSALIKPYGRFLQQITPLSTYLSPFYREVGSWFSNAGAAVDYADPITKEAKILLPVSRSNYPTVIQGPLAAVVAKLSGGLDTRGHNAYPNAGNAATPQPLTQLVPFLNATNTYRAKPPKPLKQK